MITIHRIENCSEYLIQVKLCVYAINHFRKNFPLQNQKKKKKKLAARLQKHFSLIIIITNVKDRFGKRK